MEFVLNSRHPDPRHASKGGPTGIERLRGDPQDLGNTGTNYQNHLRKKVRNFRNHEKVFREQCDPKILVFKMKIYYKVFKFKKLIY